MAESTASPLAYYAFPGLMTEPRDQTALLKGLPAEIPALCQVVQGNLLHIFWASRYGQELSPERQLEVQIRRVSTMLARIAATDNRLLTIPRPPEKRLVGNCRDFSVMMASLLRHQGIPARARCGFGAYFKDKLPYVDHWACEYWHADQGRWVMADAQLDALQIEALGIPFDPRDVPADQFILAGKAWQMCRQGQANPDDFGIFDMHGLWFIRGNLLRDLAALNKRELLPWDCWGLMEDEAADSPDNLALLDRVAALTLAGNEVFAEMRALYEGDPRLTASEVVTSYVEGTPVRVNVVEEEVFPAP